MNKVILTGRWAKDIDLRYTPSGTAIAQSTLAVEEGFGDKKQTHFLDVKIWQKTAEATANYSGKGKKVLVEGRLTQETWEKDGQKRSKMVVTVERVEFLESKGEFKQNEPKPKDPFKDDGEPIDISDSELPF